MSSHPSPRSCPTGSSTYGQWANLHAGPHSYLDTGSCVCGLSGQTRMRASVGTPVTTSVPHREHREPHLRPQWADSHVGVLQIRHNPRMDRAPWGVQFTVPVDGFACGFLLFRRTQTDRVPHAFPLPALVGGVPCEPLQNSPRPSRVCHPYKGIVFHSPCG